MERLWWVLAWSAIAIAGCTTSVPVDCPEGFLITMDGADCDPDPTRNQQDAGPIEDPLTCENMDCDDGNACTEDSCASAECTHENANDGTACMLAEVGGLCAAGECVVDCSVEDCRPVYACTEEGIRQALIDGGDVIIGCTEPTTVTLTQGELVVDNEVTLDGLGNLTVDANQASRVFDIYDSAVAELRGIGVTGGIVPSEAPGQGDGAGVFGRSGSEYTLYECRVYANHAWDDCGGVSAGGSALVAIIDSEISGNVAEDKGGGVCNNGNMTIVGTTISGNVSENDGGGIYNPSKEGVLTLDRVVLRENHADSLGGGLWTSGLLVTINDSTIAANTAEGAGGIRLWSGSEVQVSDSVISENVAVDSGGGATTFEGRLSLLRTLVAKNIAMEGRGGGIDVASDAVVDVADSVFSHNVAVHGAAIYSKAGTVRFIHSAAHSNYASRFGGAIRVYTRGAGEYDLLIENSTFSGNEGGENGGAIAVRRSSLVRLVHATLSGNISPNGSGIQQDQGTVTEIGYSAIHDGCALSEDSPFVSLGHNGVLDLAIGPCLVSASTDQALSSEQMGLATLADNGGLTPSHHPEPGSMLVDAIPADECMAEVQGDQRGELRGNGNPCDIGSVEVQSIE